MRRVITGVDPGYEQSAWVTFDGARILHHGTLPNAQLLNYFKTGGRGTPSEPADVVVFEQIHMGGMAVGMETFETVFMTGRFVQAIEDNGGRWDRLKRQAVKVHLCESVKANDANIRQALLDRFGGTSAALGKRATPGPLYGLVKHEWSAFAVALTYRETVDKLKE